MQNLFTKYSITAYHWLKDNLHKWHVYIPTFMMLGLCVVSFFLSASSHMVTTLSCATLIMALGTLYIKLNRPQNLLNDMDIPVPAFIVLSSGEIKSSNKLGVNYVIDANGTLASLLKKDGFDEYAAYRLLSIEENQTHKEQVNNIIYKSKYINPNLRLLMRYEQVSLEQQTASSSDMSENNDIHIMDTLDDLDHFINSIPIGYFEIEKNKLDTKLTPSHIENNTIRAMNKTLKEWVDNDHELLTHLSKFGSEDARKSLGLDTNSNSTLSDQDIIQIEDFFEIIHIPHKQDTKNEDILKGFVLPKNNISVSQKAHSQAHKIQTPAIDTIFQNAPIAIVMINQQEQIMDYNPAFLELFEIKALKSQKIKDYFPESERSKLNVQHTISPIEITLTVPKERILSLKITSDTQKNHKICYLSDISTQKSLEEKFNQAQKMQAIGQLAGGVAHDFNNLLTAIGGHTELLMNKFNSADHAYSDLLHIRNNVNRAGNLVRQLLAFSRRQTLKPEIITLTDFLPDISRMLERLIGDQITLKTHYAPSLNAIKADVTQLEQVIINLGVNARDAMRNQGGTLTITTENISVEAAIAEGHNIMPPAEYVKITVSDTGHGMSNEIQEKIFEPFFTTKPQGEGTGLGLSTVYGIIKQSGGFIFVDSHINQGTDFRIYFPITNEVPDTVQIIHDTQNAATTDIVAAPHTKTIMIVEDEDAVRSFVVRALELKGYHILEADCGEDALECFKDNYEKINLVITDVMMPGLSGPEWIKHAQEIRHDFTVVFMSGYTRDYFRDDAAFDLPGLNTEFLSKPFSLKVLNETVKKFVN